VFVCFLCIVKKKIMDPSKKKTLEEVFFKNMDEKLEHCKEKDMTKKELDTTQKFYDTHTPIALTVNSTPSIWFPTPSSPPESYQIRHIIVPATENKPKQIIFALTDYETTTTTTTDSKRIK